jgi:hypothetical protein
MLTIKIKQTNINFNSERYISFISGKMEGTRTHLPSGC